MIFEYLHDSNALIHLALYHGMYGLVGWHDVGNCFCALDGTIAPTGRTTETLSQHTEHKKKCLEQFMC